MNVLVGVVKFRFWRHTLLVLTTLSVGGLVYGQLSMDDEDESGAPVRPDFTELTPEQSTTAMEKYTLALKEWEQMEKPHREERFKKAVAEAEARKAERLRKEAEREHLQGSAELQPPKMTSKVEVASDYDWESEGRAQGLDEATLAQLKRDSLAIAGPDFRQAFSVYGSESIVPFVTSDSLLNGFHVLLEDSLKKFELLRSAQLRAVLEELWQNLDRRLAEEKVPRTVVEPHIRHLALVIGPALRLLGSKVTLGDRALEAEVDAVVAKIKSAQSVELPRWLEPAEPAFLAIDFRRCRPLGFYADSLTLTDYYRALRWLQLVPLRAAREYEAGAAALMAERSGRNQRTLSFFVEQGEEIWGKEDGPTVSQLSKGANDFLAIVARDGDATNAVKQVSDNIVYCSQRRLARVNDRWRTRPGSKADAAVQVLAGSVLPDVLFLEAIANKRPAGHTWPQGLEVAAWLGSDFALQKLETGPMGKLSDVIREQRKDRRHEYGGETVPEGYYEVLNALFERPDNAAPAFMNSEAWQRKSVQTALAGWAQLRHAWELQTKLIVSTVGISSRPAGFVEPSPLFFRRMNRLASSSIAALQKSGVFAENSTDEVEYLRGGLRKLNRLGAGKVDVDPHEIGFSDGEQVFDILWLAHETEAAIDLDGWETLHGKEQKLFWAKVVEVIQNRIARLERGESVPTIDLPSYRRDPDRRLFDRWQSLHDLTARMEAMAQKQLRGADWDEEESALLKNYGEELGEIMGYLADAWEMPKDDAPRWTTVFQDPAASRNLAMAIGRPRALYVLYPWQGKTILCRGAVMSYYEYPSEKRLTDPEWKQMLDSPDAPAQPEWIRPLVAPATKKL